MTIASGGTLGTGANSTSNSSYTFNTATNTLAAGNFGILISVSDNTGTSDGDNNEHTTVTGATGTWTQLGEYTNAEGSAGAGVTTSVWLFEATGTVNTGTTITLNFASNRTDKCCAFWKFTKAAGHEIIKDSQPASNPITSEVSATNGFGSSAFSALTSKPRLYLRGVGKEANSTTALTVSGSFVDITGTRSRNNAAAVLVRGEFRINTSTGETSNPTLAVSGDTAGLFLALLENPVAVAVTAGAITLTGNSQTLKAARQVAVTAGSVSLTGNSATLTYTAAAKTVTVTAGAVALTGQSTALKADRQVAVTAAAVTLTGQSTALKVGRGVNVTAGSVTLAGESVALKVDRQVSVTAGSVALTGQDAALQISRQIAVTDGAVTLTGDTASLTVARQIAVTAGEVVLTGQSVDLTYTPAAPVQAPAPSGGGGGAMSASRRKAGSGFWARVGDDSTWLDAVGTVAKARTSIVDLGVVVLEPVPVRATARVNPIRFNRDDADVLRLIQLLPRPKPKPGPKPKRPDDLATVLSLIRQIKAKKKAA
jgi:hypothetical protein